MPEWHRYETQPDAPYVKGHWYDPFNRNKLKGDYPIFGQRWFLNFTGTSETDRGWPPPAGAQRAGSGQSRTAADFFGRGRAGACSRKTLRFSFDLFRGDTSFPPG